MDGARAIFEAPPSRAAALPSTRAERRVFVRGVGAAGRGPTRRRLRPRADPPPWGGCAR